MESRWNFGLNGASSSWASSRIIEAKIHSSSGSDKRCFLGEKGSLAEKEDDFSTLSSIGGDREDNRGQSLD
jgi:hypothetical protein